MNDDDDRHRRELRALLDGKIEPPKLDPTPYHRTEPPRPSDVVQCNLVILGARIMIQPVAWSSRDRTGKPTLAELRVILRCPAVNGGALTEVARFNVLPVEQLEDPAMLARMVEDMLIDGVRHEIGELLRIDGIQVWEPHPRSDRSYPGTPEHTAAWHRHMKTQRVDLFPLR